MDIVDLACDRAGDVGWVLGMFCSACVGVCSMFLDGGVCVGVVDGSIGV